MNAPADVAIIGGGIVGCALAAFLTEAGVKVEVYEREEVGAAASGRNSGSIQHPFDPVLAELHRETLDHYRCMDEVGMPESPAGVLMLAPSASRSSRRCARSRPTSRSCADPARARRRARPRAAVAAGMWACRLETGYPVRPIAATRAFARRAHAAARASTRRRPPGRGWRAGARAGCSRRVFGARPAR